MRCPSSGIDAITKCLKGELQGSQKIGHFNTWPMDLLQNLFGHNHNLCCCPNWSNASEFETTPEQRGTAVRLHSKVVGDVIGHHVLLLRESEERCQVPKKDQFEARMSKDQKFLCKTGLGMPCLPFATRNQAENLLFSKMMMEGSRNFDEQEMRLDWVHSCDGKEIF